MNAKGRSAEYIFSLWGGIAALCAIASLLEFAFIGGLDEIWIGAVTAVAAGAIFVMLIDTMVPEAFEEIHGVILPMAATAVS